MTSLNNIYFEGKKRRKKCYSNIIVYKKKIVHSAEFYFVLEEHVQYEKCA